MNNATSSTLASIRRKLEEAFKKGSFGPVPKNAGLEGAPDDALLYAGSPSAEASPYSFIYVPSEKAVYADAPEGDIYVAKNIRDLQHAVKVTEEALQVLDRTFGEWDTEALSGWKVR